MSQYIAGLAVTGLTLGVINAAVPAAAASMEPLATVQHNNGSRISINGDLLPFASEEFPVTAGDTIEVGVGFTDFSLVIPEPSQVSWEVEVFPGDSFASVDLGDYFVSTDENFRDTVELSSTQATVIAYGFEPEIPNRVVLSPIDNRPTSVPESSSILGIVAVAIVGYRVTRLFSHEPTC